MSQTTRSSTDQDNVKTSKWNILADEYILTKTSEKLQQKGVSVYIAENKEDTVKKVFELIPEGASLFNQSSITLDTLGISKIFQESDKYDSLRKKVFAIQDPVTRTIERRKASVVDYAIGSTQAITEDGQLVLASGSGSQLAPYVYTATKVIFVIGIQKIVKNLDDAFKRIYEHVLPLETERLRKATGNLNITSNVNKILFINQESIKDRLTVIFTKESLGF